MAVRLSALRTRRTLLPRSIIIFVSGTRFCWRLSGPQGLVRPGVLGKFGKLPHRASGPRPSGLWRSALTTRLPRGPIVVAAPLKSEDILTTDVTTFISYTPCKELLPAAS
jgi:hypothetical protein